MNDDPYAQRKLITFEQAEGVEPLPRQLAPKEVSQKLRAELWNVIYGSMENSIYNNSWGTDTLKEPWATVMRVKHVHRDNLFAAISRTMQQR